MSHFGKIALLDYKHPSKTDLLVLKEVGKYLTAIHQVGGLMKHFLLQYSQDLSSIEIRKQLNLINSARVDAENIFKVVSEFILGIAAK